VVVARQGRRASVARWFAIEVGIRGNRKTLTLRALTGWGEDRTVRVLYRLLEEVRERWPDGVLRKCGPGMLALLVGEPPESGDVVQEALVEAGFLTRGEAGLVVVGWAERNGRFLRDAERKRQERVALHMFGTRPRTVPGQSVQVPGVPEQATVQACTPVSSSSVRSKDVKTVEEAYNRQSADSPRTVPGHSVQGALDVGGAEGGAQTPWAREFERFWSAWPVGHKVGRGRSEQRWMALKPKGAALLAAILDGLERWKQSDRWEREAGRFICNPATWLSEQRWKDDPVKAEKEGESWLEQERRRHPQGGG